MQSIEQIIVPVDFHQHTDDLAKFAIAIAKTMGVKLTFLHVVEHVADMARFSEEFPSAFISIDEELYGYARKKMDGLVAKSKEMYPGCAGQVVQGEAVDGIVAYVKERTNGLIIMGTHGAKGIEKILLGSVAERVLKRAACPILIFNPYKGERGYQITSPINEALQPV